MGRVKLEANTETKTQLFSPAHKGHQRKYKWKGNNWRGDCFSKRPKCWATGGGWF